MVEFVRKIRSTIEDKHLLLRPEIDLLIYEHLIYDKDGTEKQEEKMFFSIYVAGTIDYHVGKKGNDPNIAPYTNMNSKWQNKMSSRTVLPNVISTSHLWLLNT